VIFRRVAARLKLDEAKGSASKMVSMLEDPVSPGVVHFSLYGLIKNHILLCSIFVSVVASAVSSLSTSRSSSAVTSAAAAKSPRTGLEAVLFESEEEDDENNVHYSKVLRLILCCLRYNNNLIG
jgi:hypothetical protein